MCPSRIRRGVEKKWNIRANEPEEAPRFADDRTAQGRERAEPGREQLTAKPNNNTIAVDTLAKGAS